MVDNGQPGPFFISHVICELKTSTGFFEAITSFLHLDFSLLMLTKVEVLQGF